MTDYSRNIVIASWRSFFSMFLLLIPIAVPYWRSLGLSMREILQLQAIFGFAVVILEIPTGYVADVVGRKHSVVLGSFLCGLGFSWLPFATTFNSLVAFEITLALGASLVSGAEDAIVYESIPSLANRRQILGAFRVWSLMGETCAALLAGLLVLHSYSLVLWAQAAVGWIPFLCAIFMIEPPRPKLHQSNYGSLIFKAVHHTLFEDSMRRLVFINYVVWGLSSFCVVWLLQEYWTQSQVPVQYFGVLWAGLMFISAVASRTAHYIEGKITTTGAMCIVAAAPVLGYVLMAHAPIFIGITAGALFYITRGLTYVIFQDEFNRRVPAIHRATANSLQSLCFRLGFIPIAPSLGAIIDAHGMPLGLDVLAISFGVCAVVLLLPLIHALNRTEPSAPL